MTAKELIVGSALLVGAAFTAAVGVSGVAQAQEYYGPGYNQWSAGPGLYDYAAPGAYDYYGGYRFARPDVTRGGPGPRVGAGSGTGIGAVR